MRIGSCRFDTSHDAHIMGILNVTPDSFSDGGRYTAMDAALRQCEEMLKAGAAIIDVGGESTRPGYTPVSAAEEIDRTAPVIAAIHQHFPDVPISIDTHKSAVAEAALQAGACMVNDIWGLKADPQMAHVIAKHDAACCLMHNRPKNVAGDLIQDVLTGLSESIAIALAAGVRSNGIMLDPGVGFAKDQAQNLMAIRRISCLLTLGYPVLLGTSRKSVIGNALNLQKDQREEGTLTTTVYGMMNGVSFFRVHDVQANARAIAMTQAILSARCAAERNI